MGGEIQRKHHVRAMFVSGMIIIAFALTVMWLKEVSDKQPVPVALKDVNTNWQKLDTDPEGDYYYKSDNPETSSPGIATAMVQLVYNEEGKKRYVEKRKQVGFKTEKYEKFNHRNVLYEINCFSKKKEICILEVYELTKEGETLDYAKAGTYKDWSEIAPGSVYDKLYTAICPEKRIN